MRRYGGIRSYLSPRVTGNHLVLAEERHQCFDTDRGIRPETTEYGELTVVRAQWPLSVHCDDYTGGYDSTEEKKDESLPFLSQDDSLMVQRWGQVGVGVKFS